MDITLLMHFLSWSQISEKCQGSKQTSITSVKLWLFILELILASILCSIYCIMEQFDCALDYCSAVCGEAINI